MQVVQLYLGKEGVVLKVQRTYLGDPVVFVRALLRARTVREVVAVRTRDVERGSVTWVHEAPAVGGDDTRGARRGVRLKRFATSRDGNEQTRETQENEARGRFERHARASYRGRGATGASFRTRYGRVGRHRPRGAWEYASAAGAKKL